MQPLIGVTMELELDTDRDPPRLRSVLLTSYIDAVRAAGGLPLPLPVLADPDTAALDGLLAHVDGLIFTGGWDVLPARFGAAPHPRTEVMHARRDAFEFALFRRADAARVPTLAICLGFQVVHVARGGGLIQHVDDLPQDPALPHHLPRGKSAFHRVRIEADSRLAAALGGTDIEVNSRHHQAVDPQRQGAGLRPVAWSPDGLLEGSEDTRDGRFLLAVQWHPENLVDRPEHLGLFQALTRAARP